MRHPLQLLALGLSLALVLAGCAQPPAPTGSLQIDIAGLPGGIDAVVAVRGPDGFSRALDASATLDGLALGSYTVEANGAVAPAAIALYRATVSGSPATVEADSTSVVDVTYSLEPGSLEVAITGLPTGVDAAIEVAGPAGFSQTLTADTTLTDLIPGSYTLTTTTVLGDEAVVPYLYDPALPSVEVEVSSSTTARAVVPFAPRPGSGRMWIAQHSVSNALDGFDADQLTSSGAPSPAVEIVTPSLRLDGLAFEADGDLWVTDLDDRLLRYAAEDLIDGGAVTPEVVITSDGAASPSLVGPLGLAFDDAGTLWVANAIVDRIEGFTADQLAASGSPTPAVVIEPGVGGDLDAPVSIAFDAEGNLWAANRDGLDSVVAYTPDQLAVGGALEPAVVLSVGNSPTGLAFDPFGNLWIALLADGTVVRLSPAQLAMSGSPTPIVTITAASFSASPLVLSIDHDGSLWVVLNDDDVVRIAAPETLAGVTNVAPDPVLDLVALDGGFPAFWPAPPDLPIRTP